MNNKHTKMAKSANYTDADVKLIRESFSQFANDATRRAQVAELANKLGKSVQSVIGKIGTLQDENGNSLWIPYTKTLPNKRGETRAEIVRGLESMCGLDTGALDSMVTSNKVELTALVEAVNTLTDDAFIDGQDSMVPSGENTATVGEGEPA